ncbi:MAG: cell division protein ZapE [Pseudomonadales bacterium]|nr:cell division protein ZapE [Pseudomonadales bacterium]
MQEHAGPLARYRQDLQQPDFSFDAAQQRAVESLEDHYQRLCAKQRHRRSAIRRFWQAIVSPFKRSANVPERGLYFWGGVGRGKTYLMDTFYEALPFERKMRVHFHRFMRGVHQQLSKLQGEKNPLEKVAQRIARKAEVICFDEFFVSDITDAMLLAGLLDALFRRGVCLVTTSNIEPGLLYCDGLQRERFLPAIALLEEHTEVMNIDGGVDYRLRTLEHAQLYYAPIDSSTESSMLQCFQQLAPVGGRQFICIESNVPLDIEGRRICARYLADDVAWFEFEELCGGPRSQNDYIELAREFHAVLVSNVPQLGAERSDAARRFILLVDEFYDRRIKLVLSSDVELEKLYAGGPLAFEFERTSSRLREMQSHDYLALGHRA